MPFLEVNGVSMYFGGLAANQDLTFSVEGGEIRGIIGPNGAGKTTLFNVISGVYRPSSGAIFFEGAQISGLGPHQIARRGLVRTFQRVAILREFTILENVSIGRHLHARESGFAAVFGSARQMEKENEERALEIVEFIGLGDMKDELASSLPHGHQRALGVAIALAAEPRLLMLDEPVTGMNPTETQHMTGLIRKLRNEWGVTILLVEHDMRTVMGLCEKITVLNFGRMLAEGTPEEITANDEVIEAYLGAEDIVA